MNGPIKSLDGLGKLIATFKYETERTRIASERILRRVEIEAARTADEFSFDRLKSFGRTDANETAQRESEMDVDAIGNRCRIVTSHNIYR